ncbi:MAG: hypothetical protein ABSE81_01650 [Candidatus Omnitrophota bacterium]|jgi:hypothetical protein
MVTRQLREQNLLSFTIHLWLNGPEIGSFSAQKTSTHAINEVIGISRDPLKYWLKQALEPLKSGLWEWELCRESYPVLFFEQKRREGLLKAVDRINATALEKTQSILP